MLEWTTSSTRSLGQGDQRRLEDTDGAGVYKCVRRHQRLGECHPNTVKCNLPLVVSPLHAFFVKPHSFVTAPLRCLSLAWRRWQALEAGKTLYCALVYPILFCSLLVEPHWCPLLTNHLELLLRFFPSAAGIVLVTSKKETPQRRLNSCSFNDLLASFMSYTYNENTSGLILKMP
jgi:hypothetical protein